MARIYRKNVGFYFYGLACLFLLTSSINIRYRYNKELEPHIGGADFAAPLFVFAGILALPLVFRIFSNLRYTIHKNRFMLFLFVFLLPTIVGIVNAPLPEYSFLELGRQCFVIIMVSIFAIMLKFTNIKWIYYSLAGVTIAQALAVFVQLSGGQVPFISTDGAHFLNESVSRFTGVLGHPNILAGLMNIVAVFMLAGLFYESEIPRKFYLIFFVLSSMLALLSFSRAGLLVLVSSSVFLILVGSGRNLFSKKYLAFSGLIILGLVFLFIFGDDFKDRIYNSASSNVTSRLTLNTVALAAFLDYPLIGAGSNNFIYFAQDYDSSALTKYWKAPVHNLYLLFMSESGSVGIVCFLIMIWILFANFRLYRKSNIRKAKLLCAASEAALLGLLIGSLFGYFYKQEVAQPLLALIFSIGLCRFEVINRR